MNTPVLLITFNRPLHTRRVLEAILVSKPIDLFVFQDGPRDGNETDLVKILEVRRVISELTDAIPSTRVHTLFSSTNLGCGPGPAKGISWFFDSVEQGIILEDDCLPSPTLFSFYEELLERFKNNEQISLITGTNALSKWRSYKKDYIFAKTGGMTMGCWASWSRAWKLFDFEIKSWGNQDNKDLLVKLVGRRIYKIWEPILDKYYANPPKDAWDYQWAYARLLGGTFSIVSSVNQMSNIGFGMDSTHTPNADDRLGNMPFFRVSLPTRCHSFSEDRLFDWEMYQRFSRKSKKPIVTRVVLKLIDLIFRR